MEFRTLVQRSSLFTTRCVRHFDVHRPTIFPGDTLARRFPHETRILRPGHKREERKREKKMLTRFEIAASASLVLATRTSSLNSRESRRWRWRWWRRRQLRPINSTYILQGKESVKACRGETMRKREVGTSRVVELSRRRRPRRGIR